MEKSPVPTPDEIWEILKETALSQKETDRLLQESKQENDRLLRESKQENDRRRQETDRLLQESKQENDRLLRESKQENDRRRQETDRKIQENDRLLQKTQERLERMIKENKEYIQQIDSRWGNKWGKLMEVLIQGSLLKLLNQIGIKAKKVIPNYEGIWAKQVREYDLVAINGREIVVVETKATLTKQDVDDFLEKIKNFKKFCSEFKHLTGHGGVACFKSAKRVLEYAEEQGLLVIQVLGNDNAVLVNKQGFKPKTF